MPVTYKNSHSITSIFGWHFVDSNEIKNYLPLKTMKMGLMFKIF